MRDVAVLPIFRVVFFRNSHRNAFSLIFYESDSMEWKAMLALLLVLFNAVIISITMKICNFGDSMIINDRIREYSVYPLRSGAGNKTIKIRTLSVPTSNDESRWKIVAKFIFYAVLFSLNLFLLFLYILSRSLPADNVLGIEGAVQFVSEHCIAMVIAVNSSLIIPNFTHYVLAVCRCTIAEQTNKLILIIRTLTGIIVPISLSFLLLDECGSGWALLWRPCLDPSFLEILNPLSGEGHPDYILKHDDVCSVSLSNVDWNKCSRSFLDQWCSVLMVKMLIMMFMPIAIVLKQTLDRKLRGKRTEIVIDSEYTMLTTKLELIFVFGPFCPLLYPLVIASMNSFIFFYLFAAKRLKWNIRFENHDHGLRSFPFHFLCFGIVFEQMLSFLFMATSDQHRGWGIMNDAISWSLLAVYAVMDVVAFWRYRGKQRDRGQDSNIDAVKRETVWQIEMTQGLMADH